MDWSLRAEGGRTIQEYGGNPGVKIYRGAGGKESKFVGRERVESSENKHLSVSP